MNQNSSDNFLSNLTWRCEICNRERPDRFINVFKKPTRKINLAQNIKYCNDNEDCYNRAQSYDLFKGR